MKKLLTFLLVVTMILSSSIVFADSPHEITKDELSELATKYNFAPTVVTENISAKDIKTGLTKNEVEKLILTLKSEIKKPIRFENEIKTDVLSKLSLETNSLQMVSAAGTGWITVNKSKNLDSTSNHMGLSEFKIKKSVLSSYQYESLSLPGEPTKTQNWKFTATNKGSVVHLNPGAYIMKSVTSNASYTSSTITQNYSGVVNVGLYTIVAGIVVRIPIGDNAFSGMQTYSISLCK